MDRKGRETVKPEKLKTVEEIVNLIGKYKVIGLLGFNKTPASTIQIMKSLLRGKAVIKVAKKRLVLFALEKAGKQNLKEHVEGYPGLLLTDMDPFKIYNYLERNKVPAAAKAGDAPDKDIVINEGPTELMPGPAISTLTKVKIPAKVQGGKIGILKDFTAVKAGEKISLDMASALQLLKLKPMVTGLTITMMEDNGIVYTGDQLLVDEDLVLGNIQRAIQNAFNLSMNSSYPTKETIRFMISKAYLSAKALESQTGAPKEEPKEKKPAEEKQEAPAEENKEAQAEEKKENTD